VSVRAAPALLAAHAHQRYMRKQPFICTAQAWKAHRASESRLSVTLPPRARRFLDSGGVYKLAFGPKAFIVVSDPVVVRHLLKARRRAACPQPQSLSHNP